MKKRRKKNLLTCWYQTSTEVPPETYMIRKREENVPVFKKKIVTFLVACKFILLVKKCSRPPEPMN
jgi:hypothetical protein